MNALYYLDKQQGLSLQDQLYEMLIKRMQHQQLLPGQALPSTRALAQQLNISRNTVLAVYDKLQAYGYLVAYARRGYFLADPLPLVASIATKSVATVAQVNDVQQAVNKPVLQIKGTLRNTTFLSKPTQWRNLDFPFISGQIDTGLFLNHEWQECCRILNHSSFIPHWLDDRIEQDDEALIECIHQQVLPKRGIQCNPDNILITQGSQQSLYLLSQLLLDKNTLLAMESPCYPDAYQLFVRQGTHIVDINMRPDRQKIECWPDTHFYYVTPSHHCPTQRTMTLSEREALLRHCQGQARWIIEDDYEYELNFKSKPLPALKAMDKEDAVFYLGSFSKVIAPGIRLGFMVAPKSLIEEARMLRRMMIRHPSGYLQRAVALFIKRGYYDQQIGRLIHAYKQRYAVITDRLEALHFPMKIFPSTGGSALWIDFQQSKHIHTLLTETLSQSLYFEPGHWFYPNKTGVLPCTGRFGFSVIDEVQIDKGMQVLKPILEKWYLRG